MYNKQLPEANQALAELVDQLESDPQADTKLRDDARDALANSQYYLTWVMRLEGLGPAEWEPEIEGSRQTYRLLAEQAEARGDGPAAKNHRESLESAVRLARMLGTVPGVEVLNTASHSSKPASAYPVQHRWKPARNARSRSTWSAVPTWDGEAVDVIASP